MGIEVEISLRRNPRRRVIRLTSMFITLVFLGFLMIQKSCARSRSGVELSEQQAVQEFVLSKRAGQGDVHRLVVGVSGTVDGRVRCSLVEGDQETQIETLSGAVQLEWNQDWYTDTAEVRFELLDGKGGRLELSYRFED